MQLLSTVGFHGRAARRSWADWGKGRLSNLCVTREMALGGRVQMPKIQSYRALYQCKYTLVSVRICANLNGMSSSITHTKRILLLNALARKSYRASAIFYHVLRMPAWCRERDTSVWRPWPPVRTPPPRFHARTAAAPAAPSRVARTPPPPPPPPPRDAPPPQCSASGAVSEISRSQWKNSDKAGTLRRRVGRRALHPTTV